MLRNKILSITLVATISCSAASQLIDIGDPAPVMNFQEVLWDDMWGDVFLDGVDLLLSTQPFTDNSQAIHRVEWDESTTALDGVVDVGTMSSVETWDMDWEEYESEFITIDGIYDGEYVFWQADITARMLSFSGTLVSDQGLSRIVYGMVCSIEIVETPLSGGNTFVYQCWMPIGRAKTIENADLSAEALANSYIQPPSFIVETQDDCVALWNSRMPPIHDTYLTDLDNCGGFIPFVLRVAGGAAGGMATGGVIGGSIGGIVGGGPPGATAGGTAGGFFGGIIGAIANPFVGKVRCNERAIDKYTNAMHALNRCEQECRETGTWYCN